MSSVSDLKIAIVGYGRSPLIDAVIHNIQAALERDAYISMIKACDCTEEDLEKQRIESILIGDKIISLSEAIQEIRGLEYKEPTIDQLKKQIKYSKNPLEIKKLNKKLNVLYKKTKSK